MDELVTTSVTGPVATITLNSQADRNALSHELIAQLAATLTDCAHRTELRAVVLTHTGSAFCSGANLKEGAAGPLRSIAELPTLLAAAAQLPIPLIAAVSGAVRGGGLGLLCAADIVLATSTSSFGFSEARVGAVPTVIWPLVAARITPSSRYLLLTGETFDAAEGVRIGLVTRDVGNRDLDSAVTDTIAAVLLGAPSAIRSAKALLGTPLPERAADQPWQEYLQAFAAASAAAFASDEGREGAAAFAAKRAPRWAVEPPQ